MCAGVRAAAAVLVAALALLGGCSAGNNGEDSWVDEGTADAPKHIGCVACTGQVVYSGQVGTFASFYWANVEIGHLYDIALTLLQDDADLYARFDPTDTSPLSSTKVGTADEIIEDASADTETLYILVHGVFTTAGTTFRLVITDVTDGTP